AAVPRVRARRARRLRPLALARRLPDAPPPRSREARRARPAPRATRPRLPRGVRLAAVSERTDDAERLLARRARRRLDALAQELTHFLTVLVRQMHSDTQQIVWTTDTIVVM